MSWIQQIPEEKATGPLAKIYAAASKRAGKVANIIKVMSLKPQPLATFLDLYLQLMRGNSELPRPERELLATVTSEVNGCFY